jgi:ribonucleoside-diphosphate reductase beta chain
MSIENIKKRSGELVPFDKDKITQAVYKCLEQIGHKDSLEDAEKITKKVDKRVTKFVKEHGKDFIPNVEEVQDMVEFELMKAGFFEAAKSYILYRDHKNQERRRDIFKPRMNLKPYEYPELLEYVDAIRHSYWVHTEFSFTSDVQDFKVNVTPSERNALQNCMLAIAQIEVSVKTFWGDIYKHLPKSEVGSVGQTFAESEVRHMDAYSHLLEVLGLNADFERIKHIPVMNKRVNYLQDSLKTSKSDDPEEYSHSILLFSLFIEHVSLFSQFLIIMAFNKHNNIFKGISNVVEATSKEEQIHGLFGIELINIIKQEHPTWFDDEHNNEVKKACIKAYESEMEIVDWIFEEGEIDFLPKDVISEFIKNRFNNSLDSIGLEKIFETNDELLAQTDWFDDEIMSTKHWDFFVKRSVNYNKRSKSITSDDLF